MEPTLDLGLLQTFVTIADEGTISGAAIALHMSQPAVSRQLRALEKQVGQQLVVRSNKTITLTEAGNRLYVRAHPLLIMARATLDELQAEDDDVVGEIRIGAGETPAFAILAQAATELEKRYPRIHVSVHSGGGHAVEEGLLRGEFSFGLFVQPWDLARYQTLQLPQTDTWGVLVREDSPLLLRAAANASEGSYGITMNDLHSLRIVAPEHVVSPNGSSHWLGTTSDLTICGTFNLLYNAVVMVGAGIDGAICIDILRNDPSLMPNASETLALSSPTLQESGTSAHPLIPGSMRFIPFTPRITSRVHVAWLRGRTMTKAEYLFLQYLEAQLQTPVTRAVADDALSHDAVTV